MTERRVHARCRNLLGDAVDVAAAEQDLARGDADEIALGEATADDIGGLVVAARVEQREDDARGADVEVDVRRWRGDRRLGAASVPATASTPDASSTVIVTSLGSGSSTTSSERPASVGRGLQSPQRVARDLVPRVRRVVGPAEQHDAGTHETGEVVDMAVGLASSHSPRPEPQNLLGSEVLAQRALDLPTRERRVAAGAEQALFGVITVPSPSDVDRAALEHERRTVARGAFDLEHLGGGAIVAVPREVQPAIEASPRVEVPVDAAQAAAVVEHERRPDVAHPRVVGPTARRRARRRGGLSGSARNCASETAIVTGSDAAIASATAANARWAGFAPRAPVVGPLRQAIQQPACGSNSPGIRKPSAAGVDASGVLID